MDVFGELDVDMLAAELEAEQSFTFDGLGETVGYVPEAQIAAFDGPLDGESDFNEFSAMNSFTAYDTPHDSLSALNGEPAFNGALNGVLAEWLEAFVSADDAAIVDDKADLLLMDEDEVIVVAPRVRPWDAPTSISIEQARAIYGSTLDADIAALLSNINAALIAQGFEGIDPSATPAETPTTDSEACADARSQLARKDAALEGLLYNPLSGFLDDSTSEAMAESVALLMAVHFLHSAQADVDNLCG